MLSCCECALVRAGILRLLRDSVCCCCRTAAIIAVLVLRRLSGTAAQPAVAVLLQGRRGNVHCVRAILSSLSKG